MEFEPRDRAAYLPAADALVCADLHVGRDATSDVEVRLGEHEDLTGRFDALLQRYEPRVAVVAGDLLHSFGGLPRGVAETVRGLQHTAGAVECDLVVTPGNHDPMLEELWAGERASSYRIADAGAVVAHGHVEPASRDGDGAAENDGSGADGGGATEEHGGEADADVEAYVVGHDHPTIEIEGRRRPCYLYGPGQYRGADVLMLPAFSRLPAGVAVNDMSTRDFQSPLVTDAGGLRPIVRDEDVDATHEFPPLRAMRRHL